MEVYNNIFQLGWKQQLVFLFPQEFHPDDKGTTTKIEGILGFVASTDHFSLIVGIPTFPWNGMSSLFSHMTCL